MSKDVKISTDIVSWVKEHVVESKSEAKDKDETYFVIKASDRAKLLENEGVSVDILKKAADIDKEITTAGILLAGEYLSDVTSDDIKALKKEGKSEEEIVEILKAKKSCFRLKRHDGEVKQTIKPVHFANNPGTGESVINYGQVSTKVTVSRSYDKDALTTIKEKLEKTMKNIVK
jgi:hypothetical protein